MIFIERCYEIRENYKNNLNEIIRYYNAYVTSKSELYYKYGILNGNQIKYYFDEVYGIISIKITGMIIEWYIIYI